MEYLKYVTDNWPLVLATVVVVTFLTFHIARWLQKPRAKQIADMKEWLKFAVVEAEKALGSGTGELKLRAVYDKAITIFPWVKFVFSFEQFKALVDEALEWMEKELAENPAIANYVGKE